MNEPVPFLRKAIPNSTVLEALAESRLAGLANGKSHSLVRLGLLHILSKEPVSLSSLAESLCCQRSNVTSSIDRLERDGWVRRRPQVDDRRVILAELTEAGALAYTEALEAMTQLERELLEVVGPEKAAEIAAALEAIEEAAETLASKAI